MNNAKVRIAMIECNMKQYELAQIMGRHEGSVSRMLRDELPEDEQNRIVDLIRQHTGHVGGVHGGNDQ